LLADRNIYVASTEYSDIISTWTQHSAASKPEIKMTNLIPNANWQTQQRGDNDSEYQIYVAAAESLGWTVKTYEQWLRS
jgi:hypothetical protein